MNQFDFRPHCGNGGSVEHLIAGFLFGNSITHGINLRKNSVLQYLFYLERIGIAMSPLSENILSVKYRKNPLEVFFKRGLNVSLSTDNPLMLHTTEEPLFEEIAIASQIWRFDQCDLSEMARNSVMLSGFNHPLKLAWLGPNYWKQGIEGNDWSKTNLPNIRIAFRYKNWLEERKLLDEYGGSRYGKKVTDSCKQVLKLSVATWKRKNSV